MIKIEHIYTGNWEAAIRSMRNPLDSWSKSDSGFGCFNENRRCMECHYKPDYCGISNDHYILGPNDLKLAKTLANAGTDHRKFMRSIIFSCDITAPMYWWKEMDTYKVGSVRNSCSTMHTITKKEFTLDDFSHEHLFKDNALIVHIPNDFRVLNNTQWMMCVIDLLNGMREAYLEEDDAEKKKEFWWQIIQLLPSSYNQKATWTANYEVLRNIYRARINHKLDEWHDFCYMIEDLPYSELITGGE